MDSTCLEGITAHSKNILYPKASGAITITGDTVQFERSRVVLQSNSKIGLLIFQNRLLFPELILGVSTTGSHEFKISGIGFIGSLSLSSFEEISDHGPSNKIRSYSFLLWKEGLVNPLLYIFQLTNPKAHAEMDQTEFIRGARLYTIGFCSILI